MGFSNAQATKAAVLALVRALPAATAEKWDIDWGFSKNPDRTWVYCGEITWDSSEWVTNRSREEVFRVRLIISVKKRRTTPEGVERDAMRISELIEAAVKASPNLGIPTIVTTDYVPRKMDSFPADDFSEAGLEVDIRVTARL